ncbi:MAG: 2-phosphosulfolactate phosphatase [Gammaproteobacteria bacterium]
MAGSVVIDSFPESAQRYLEDHAIVVADVIRATTTAVTALHLGRRVYVAATVDEASVLASRLEDPLMAGELGGNMPFGYEMTNSPAQTARRTDIRRPMVLVSSSGTQLLMNAKPARAVYVACFRNLTAVAEYLSGRYDGIALLGAGTRGQFRREDQMACAWIAGRLVDRGFRVTDRQTGECMDRWRGAAPEEARYGRSADYLTRSGQLEDLEFVLSHIDDVATVPLLCDHELVPVPG